LDEINMDKTLYQLGDERDFLKEVYLINSDFDTIYFLVAGQKKPMKLPLKKAAVFVDELQHIIKTITTEKARYETELLRIANADLRDHAAEEHKKGRKK
jgi:hypothetical protein